MPRYDYINDKTGEVREIVQSMTEEHRYFDENGKEWRRIFTVPEMAIDSSFANIDVNDPKSFLKKTEKGGRIGDCWDMAAEWSEKRGSAGNDHVKEKWYKDYEKKNKRKHDDVKKREVAAKCKKAGISITPD